MSDDIGVCVILAKRVHSKPQVVRCTDCHRSSSIFRCTPDAPGREFSRVENTMVFFRHIWSKYAMDGYIACTNVCLRDLDGGR